jgi:5'-3' exonuclease
MGVRDLFVFLRNHNIPYEKHRPSYFAKSTLAVDGYSLFFRLYYAAKKMGFKNHRETAIGLLDAFLHKWPETTNLIFVLDSPVKTDMKKATLMKRRADEFALQKEILELEKAAAAGSNPIIRARQEVLRQRSKETFPQVCRDMIDFLRSHDYRVLVSDGEAERTACEMVIADEAQYVYSNDSDCLALSCPAIIFEDVGGFLHVFRLASILSPLQLRATEFTDFCILLGTDFNDRIQGPEEAFNSISKFRRIEDIPGIDGDTLAEVERVRQQYHPDPCQESYDDEPPKVKVRRSLRPSQSHS